MHPVLHKYLPTCPNARVHVVFGLLFWINCFSLISETAGSSGGGAP